jgi:hypothetical protein
MPVRSASRLKHDPKKWIPVFHATNARRLREDDAQSDDWSAMTIQSNRIAR